MFKFTNNTNSNFDSLVNSLIDTNLLLKTLLCQFDNNLFCRSKFNLECTCIPNPYGGNPSVEVVYSLNTTAHHEPIKLVWQLQSESEKSFVNRVKACIFDTVCNMF